MQNFSKIFGVVSRILVKLKVTSDKLLNILRKQHLLSVFFLRYTLKETQTVKAY